MCAIAGLLFKNGHSNDFPMTTGAALTAILDATLHRGPDSTGWALYHPPVDDLLRMRFFISENAQQADDIEKIHQTLADQQVEVVTGQALGCTYGVTARFDGDVLALTRAIERAVGLVSIGTRLEIVKDVGQPYELAPRYDIESFNGSHGIAHIRLATESGDRKSVV